MKNNNQDFFKAMGADSDLKTDKQMLFLYLLELKINKEIKILREEMEEKQKGTTVIYFDDEDF